MFYFRSHFGISGAHFTAYRLASSSGPLAVSLSSLLREDIILYEAQSWHDRMDRLRTDLQGASVAGPDPQFLRSAFNGSMDPNVPLGISPNDAHRAMMVKAITNAAGVLSVPLSFSQLDNLVSASTRLNTTYTPGAIPHKQTNVIVPTGLPKMPVFVPEKEYDGYMKRCMLAFAPGFYPSQTFLWLRQKLGMESQCYHAVFNRLLPCLQAAHHLNRKLCWRM